ncbi:S-adenosyl-L-methionine-dependent methyltransferase [Periconia macrospinosa]|uniref:S-adenosyl-L-methionine-dependent methyltransferase n=1 Tax=Periconia macrospinosa TaxID=97972 RepID=A0A2V1DAY5_9PLEO|nr:S-adenosyl-L-methionine-dependent methyltransferase [Periconia macrospinosa]
MSQAEEVKTLIAQLERFTNSPPQDIDNSTRIKLREASKNLSIAVELQSDTLFRIGFSTMQLYMARVGNDAKIWTVLAESDGPLSLAQIAEKTKVDPILLKRVLRYYASLRMLDQPGEDAYAANNVTRTLAGPGDIAVEYFATLMQKPFEAIPRYLKKHDYKNPAHPTDSPWQEGYETELHPFVWLQNNPGRFGLFMQWVHLSRAGLPLWFDVFPFDQVVGHGSDKNIILFVDIGSALGHQSIALRQRFPDLPGRVIIQDTPQVISAVQPSHDIEPQVYDFFTPQPVKGARAYYLRNIIHDWPDEQAVAILKNQISAMSEDSVVLIDDMVLPEKGSPWRATQLDMAMMATLAAWERSETQWYALLEKAGLEIVKIWKYTEECDDCIIVAKPKKAV